MAIKSVTINAGNCQYIDKNIRVIGIDYTGDATLTSDCIDLTTAESYDCYCLVISGGQDNSGSTDSTLETSRLKWTGIKIGNTVYDFTAPVPHEDTSGPFLFTNSTFLPALVNAINAVTPIPGLMLNPVVSINTANDFYATSTTYYLVFKGLPSIMSNFYLVGTSDVGLTGSGYGNSTFILYIQPRLHSDVIASMDDSSRVPECPPIIKP